MSSVPLKLWINHFYAHDVYRLQRAIDKCVDKGQDALPVFINSPGGSIYAMCAMMDIIESSPIPIATIAMGAAMSAGAELLAAGKKGLRFISPSTTIMVHQAVVGMGAQSISDASNLMEHFQTIEERCQARMDKNCGKRKGYWKKQFAAHGNTDIYMTAEEAVEHGLADHVSTGAFFIKPEQTAVIMPEKR